MPAKDITPQCSGVRNTGHWKGYPCGAAGLYEFEGKFTCANHFPIKEAVRQIADHKLLLSGAYDEIHEYAETVSALEAGILPPPELHVAFECLKKIKIAMEKAPQVMYKHTRPFVLDLCNIALGEKCQKF